MDEDGTLVVHIYHKEADDREDYIAFLFSSDKDDLAVDSFNANYSIVFE